MKILILLFLPVCIFAQNPAKTYSKAQLMGDWVKTDIRLKDNSRIYDENIHDTQIRYHFISEDTLLITYQGIAQKYFYRFASNLIVIPKTDGRLRVEELDDRKMVISEQKKDSTRYQLRLTFVKVDIFNLGFTPQSYLTQGNDTVYVAQRNYLEPIFIDEFRNSMDYISEKFDFPEWKTGEFYARFIITKDAQVKAIKIEGKPEKQKEDLIKAIRKTKGKWIAAKWEGKPVNAEIKMYFDYGEQEKLAFKNKTYKKSQADSLAELKERSKFFLDEGNYYFTLKNYLKALQSYSKSIGLNPYNVDAYYGRIAVYSKSNRIDKVCEELEQLKALEQTKAFELSKQYCEKK
jgi:tetratricopeptide (TPR) repeat protein